MDDEQKRWSAQYTANIGVREFLRLFCAIMLWVLIGVGTSIVFDLAGYSFGSIIISIFIIMMFVFPFFAVSRKPTYLLLRKILGNESLPKEPYPRSNGQDKSSSYNRNS